MKKALFLAVGLLLVASIVQAACSTPPEGNRSFRYGWGMVVNPSTTMETIIPPPGIYNLIAVNGQDTTWGIPGAALKYRVGPYNATAWKGPNNENILCVNQDTLCYDVSSTHGWTIVTSPAAGTAQVLPPGGYLWYQTVTIQIPCSATIGSYERVVAVCAYTNFAGVCDPTCVDCSDPDTRANGTHFYSSDTLWVHVLPAPPPPAPSILQDSITYVEQGQTQAYIPFSLCNNDKCFAYDIGYHIVSKGHIGPAVNLTGSVNVGGGKCVDVFAIINAGGPPLPTVCTFDTITTICWTVVAVPLYDTCVMLLHIVEPSQVPLFTVPVVTILVLALILAAAVFMRRRAVSRA
jgi:hypothetical protein